MKPKLYRVEYKLSRNHTIADAKRGILEIQAVCMPKHFFEDRFDSITTAPYMGKDSIEPFLAFEDKHTILHANIKLWAIFNLESNSKPFYQSVLETSKTWASRI